MIDFCSLLDWISSRIRPSDPVELSFECEKRQFQRLATVGGHAHCGDYGPFQITNISFGGARIQVTDQAFLAALQPGTDISIRLIFPGLRLETKMQVCSISQAGELGCSFTCLTEPQERMLSDFLKPGVIGSSFHEVSAPAATSPDQNVRLRHFQGQDGAQIFLWQTLEGDVVKQEYYFLDYVITMQKSRQTLRTGRVSNAVGSGSSEAFGRIAPDRIVFFNVPSFRALRMGKSILELSSLPAEAKDHLLSGIASEEKRLYRRYSLREHDAQVRFYHTFYPDQPFPVGNLSFSGVALLFPDDFAADNLAGQHDLSGFLAIGTYRYPASITVVYCNRQALGGVLTLINDQGKAAVAEFLAPRLLGQSLEEDTPPGAVPAAVAERAKAYYFTGLHNTHVLTLMVPGGCMALGRIVFMDCVLAFDGQMLTEYQCPRGTVFPPSWELPPDLVDAMPLVSADLVAACRLLLAAAALPTEVREGWNRVLPTLSRKRSSAR